VVVDRGVAARLACSRPMGTALTTAKDMTGLRCGARACLLIEEGCWKTEGGMGLLLYYTGGRFVDTTIRVVFKTASGSAPTPGIHSFLKHPNYPCRRPTTVTRFISTLQAMSGIGKPGRSIR